MKVVVVLFAVVLMVLVEGGACQTPFLVRKFEMDVWGLTAMVFADMNEDGFDDVLAYSQWGGVFVMERLPVQLAFKDAFVIGEIGETLRGYGGAVAGGDVDGLGGIDVVVAATTAPANEAGSPRGVVLWSRRQGPLDYAPWEVIVDTTEFAWSLGLLDVEQDGLVDIFFGSYGSSGFLSLIRNFGGGAFATDPEVLLSGAGVASIQVVDANGGERGVLAAIPFGDSYPNGGLVFVTAPLLALREWTGFPVTSARAGSLADDGSDVEISVFASSSVGCGISSLPLSAEGSPFSEVGIDLGTAVTPGAVFLGDVDSDGAKDVLFISAENAGRVQYWPSGVQSRAVQLDPVFDAPWLMLAQDMDMDGDLDVVVYEQGSGRLVVAQVFLPLSQERSVVVGPDVLSSGALRLSTGRESSFRIPLVDSVGNPVDDFPMGDLTLSLSRLGDTIAIEAERSLSSSGSPEYVFSVVGPVERGVYTLSLELDGSPLSYSPLLVFVAEDCLAGYRLSGDFDCSPCAASTYSSTVNSERCRLCPAFSTSPPLSTAAQNCSCLEGFWIGGASFRAGRPCQPCPVGASCRGGASFPVSSVGFQESSPGSFSFVQCPRKNACASGPSCREGATGYLCRECVSGFYSTVTTECSKCLLSPVVMYVAMVVVLVVLTLVLAAGTGWSLMRVREIETESLSGSKSEQINAFRTRSTPASLSLVLIAFQMIGVVSEVEVGWSSTSKSTLSVFGIFNINASYFGMECALGSFHMTYLVSVLVPFAVMGLVIALLFWARRNWRRFDMLYQMRYVKRRSIFDGVIFTLSSLFYIPMSKTTFSLFDCTELPDGSIVIDSDPGELCFDSTWWLVFPIGLFGLVFGVFGVPAYFSTVLIQNRASLYDPKVMARFGSLYRLYRVSYYWGEVAGLAKRLSVVAVSVFFSKHQLVQFACLFAVLLSTSYFVSRQKPYYFTLYNDLEFRLSLVVLTIVILGMGSYAERSRNSSDLLFTLAIIAAVIVLVAVAGLGIYRDLTEIRLERANLLVVASQRTTHLMEHITVELHDVEADGNLLIAAGSFFNVLENTVSTTGRTESGRPSKSLDGKPGRKNQRRNTARFSVAMEDHVDLAHLLEDESDDDEDDQ